MLALLWILSAGALFFGFGFVLGSAVLRMAESLGLAEPGSASLVVPVTRVVAGVLMLGISRVYRRSAGQANAGSVAASLAGWGLLLYALGSLTATVSEYLPPILLLAALGAWIVWKMASIFGDNDDDSPT